MDTGRDDFSWYHNLMLGSKGHLGEIQMKLRGKYDKIKENTGGVFSCHTEQISASRFLYLIEAFA